MVDNRREQLLARFLHGKLELSKRPAAGLVFAWEYCDVHFAVSINPRLTTPTPLVYAVSRHTQAHRRQASLWIRLHAVEPPVIVGVAHRYCYIGRRRVLVASIAPLLYCCLEGGPRIVPRVVEAAWAPRVAGSIFEAIILCERPGLGSLDCALHFWRDLDVVAVLAAANIHIGFLLDRISPSGSIAWSY